MNKIKVAQELLKLAKLLLSTKPTLFEVMEKEGFEYFGNYQSFSNMVLKQRGKVGDITGLWYEDKDHGNQMVFNPSNWNGRTTDSLFRKKK